MFDHIILAYWCMYAYKLHDSNTINNIVFNTHMHRWKIRDLCDCLSVYCMSSVYIILSLWHIQFCIKIIIYSYRIYMCYWTCSHIDWQSEHKLYYRWLKKFVTIVLLHCRQSTCNFIAKLILCLQKLLFTIHLLSLWVELLFISFFYLVVLYRVKANFCNCVCAELKRLSYH